MAHQIVTVRYDNPLRDQGQRKRNLLRRLIRKAYSVVAGIERSTNVAAQWSASDPACANGALILASGSGTVGFASLAGVAFTSTWATSDVATAGVTAANVNASVNPLIQYSYGATNLKTSLSLASVLAGTTISLAGFVFTASAAAPLATQGYSYGLYSIAGNDTADALALANAINAHPAAQAYLFAIPIAAVVHVYPRSAAWFTGPNSPPNIAQASAATVTVSSATFVASAHCGVYARMPGRLPNGIPLTATGTGATVSGGATTLLRGLGGDGAPVFDLI